MRSSPRPAASTPAPCRSAARVYPVFFFQAEDGIRDLTVTGVQTCALPISATLPTKLGGLLKTPLRWSRIRAAISWPLLHRVAISNHRLVSFTHGQVTFRWREIGRASCRERV